MVAMLELAVGQVDRRRMCTFVGGNVVAGLEDRGDRRMQRHVMIICQMELEALSVDAAECRRSSGVDKSSRNLQGIREQLGMELEGFDKKNLCSLDAALRLVWTRTKRLVKLAQNVSSIILKRQAFQHWY